MDNRPKTGAVEPRWSQRGLLEPGHPETDVLHTRQTACTSYRDILGTCLYIAQLRADFAFIDLPRIITAFTTTTIANPLDTILPELTSCMLTSSSQSARFLRSSLIASVISPIGYSSRGPNTISTCPCWCCPFLPCFRTVRSKVSLVLLASFATVEVPRHREVKSSEF